MQTCKCLERRFCIFFKANKNIFIYFWRQGFAAIEFRRERENVKGEIIIKKRREGGKKVEKIEKN